MNFKQIISAIVLAGLLGTAAAEKKGKKMIELPDVFNGGFNGTLAESELRNEAARMRRMHQLPFTLEEWKPGELRARIWKSLGVSVDHTVPLEMKITKTIQLDGYKIHNLSYQSRPGVRVTGNLYVPDGKGPFPAVINLHGHWEQGRLAGRIQERGHILAKSGYICLAVDAFGTGERCPEHGKFVSHGGLLGGATFQFGETLMGLQLADNIRGIDLLCSLPYVQKDRIGACGASGGGNQTMWLAAMDERIKAAVPVVSVGTFESYILCNNCLCEVLPDGLTFTEEAGVLALVAPRALMTVNGIFDANAAFNPAQTRISVDEARRIFRAYGVPENIRQVVMEERHAFSPLAQRAMLGWFEKHLKGIGNGDPAETLPEYEILPESDLMVYKVGKRPADVVSLPEYVRKKEAYWKKHAVFSKEKLRTILRLEPLSIRQSRAFTPRQGWERIGLIASDGRLAPILFKAPAKGCRKVVIFGAPYLKSTLLFSPMIRELVQKGIGILLIDLWGSGENDLRLDTSYRDRFYNRSLMWLGKNLQGKWVEDFLLAETWLKERLPGAEIAAAGFRDSVPAACMYAALRSGKTDLYLEMAPLSMGYSPEVSRRFGQGFIVPGILTCGDLPVLQKKAGGKVYYFGTIK